MESATRPRMDGLVAQSRTPRGHWLSLLALLPLVACGGGTSDTPAGVAQAGTAGVAGDTASAGAQSVDVRDASDATAPLPACAVPSGYDGSEPGSCLAKRAFVSCISS